MTHTPLLAAGAGEIVPVIVVLITIASAIVNFIKEKAQAAQREQQVNNRDAKRDPQLQSEIEQFLEQVSAGTSRGRNRSEPVEVTDADVFEQPSRKRERPPQQRQKEPQKPKTSVAERHLESKGGGKISDRHVQSQVREHHLQSQVAQSHLTTHVGGGTVEVSASSIAASSSFAELLSNPDTVRNAMILNEILSPPLARRKTKA